MVVVPAGILICRESAESTDPDLDALKDFTLALKRNEKDSERSGPDKVKSPASVGIASATMALSLLINTFIFASCREVSVILPSTYAREFSRVSSWQPKIVEKIKR